MGLCNTVKYLSQKILDSEISLTPLQELRLEILKLGPLYLRLNDLSHWDKAIQGTLADVADPEKAEGLINDVEHVWRVRNG